MTTTVNTYEDLVETQKALESAAVLEGIERYQREVSRKGAGETLQGQVIIKKAIEPVVDVLRVTMADAASGQSNRSAAYLKFLSFIDTHTVAFIGLNTVFNKLNRTETEIKLAIGMSLEDELNVTAFRKGYGLEEGDREGLMRYLVTEVNKRSSRANRRIYLNKALSHAENFENLGWNDETRARLGGVILDAVLTVNNLFNKVMRTERSRGQLKTVRYIEPAEELVSKMGEMNQFFAVQRPVYGPMVVKPLAWDRKLRGGYLTKRLGLIKGANLNYLSDALESGKLDSTFSALNMLQDTAWAINSEVLAVAKSLWDANAKVAGLPDHGKLEKPHKPVGSVGREAEYALENPEEWRTWKKAASEFYAWSRSAERLGKIVEVNAKLNTALRYEQFEALHFVYQLDFRGRLYPVATGLNPQGDDLSHGLLTFANGKLMTEDAAVWLAVHGANCWALSSTKDGKVLDEWMFARFGAGSTGLDKTSFTVRHSWVKDHEKYILASARDPLNYTWWARAENPWQFLAFCFEYAGWKSEGTNWVTTLPIAADGSCNGIQHYAAMMRDAVEGAAVNLTPGDQPADIYSVVAKTAQEIVMQDAVEGTKVLLNAVVDAETGEVKAPEVQLKTIAALLQGHVNRKFVKRGVMTTPYGVSKFGLRDQLKDEQKAVWSALDKRLQKPALSYATEVVSKAIGSAVSSATQGMEYLQGVAKVAAESELPLVFSTFDGFPVQVAHKKMASKRIRTTLSGGINLKINAVSTFRKELEDTLTKKFGEPTSWAMLSELSYGVCHGNMTDPEFAAICRDLLTSEFKVEQVEFVASVIPSLAAKHLKENVSEEGDKKIVNYTLMEPTNELDKLKQARAIGPHFVHAADACHLRLTLNALKELGIQSFAAVHDSYAVHATDFALMGQVLREQFVRMHEANLLARFLEDVSALIPEDKLSELPEVPAKGDLELSQVLESDYFFA